MEEEVIPKDDCFIHPNSEAYRYVLRAALREVSGGTASEREKSL